LGRACHRSRERTPISTARLRHQRSGSRILHRLIARARAISLSPSDGHGSRVYSASHASRSVSVRTPVPRLRYCGGMQAPSSPGPAPTAISTASGYSRRLLLVAMAAPYSNHRTAGPIRPGRSSARSPCGGRAALTSPGGDPARSRTSKAGRPWPRGCLALPYHTLRFASYMITARLQDTACKR